MLLLVRNMVFDSMIDAIRMCLYDDMMEMRMILMPDMVLVNLWFGF